MEEKLMKIISHFGVNNQLKKLNEECYELIEAIRDWEDDDVYGSKDHIEEEIADVLTLLHQLVAYYELNKASIFDTVEDKIDRTIERIESGYYDKK